MVRLAANLSLLFNEEAFLDRFRAARAVGFKAVEVQFPYPEQARDIRRALDDSALSLVLHNFPAGDWEGGERGIACHPDRIDEFREGVSLGLEYAKALNCSRLNVLAGLAPDGVEAYEGGVPAGMNTTKVVDTLGANLAYAAREALVHGIDVMVEPLNTADVPGFFLNRFDAALALVRETGAKNLYVQFDIYHMHRMDEDVADILETHLDAIGHIQLADAPGRHEPGTGEIDVPGLLARLDRLGYGGWVGCEYIPAGNTLDGLGWVREYLN